MGDEIEVKAIEKLVSQGTRTINNSLLVSSTKGATGHLLGAAGALEAAFTVQSIVSGIVPDTKNLEEVDVGDYSEDKIRILKDGEVRSGEKYRRRTLLRRWLLTPRHSFSSQVEERNVRLAISNSFGFGGVNSSILFGAFTN